MTVEPALPAGVTVGLSDGARDLDGILALQVANREVNLDPAEAARDGFVTAVHTRPILEAMHARLPSVVARREGEVVGYALSMDLACGPLVPALEPMFDNFAALRFDGRALTSFRFYVMGQVCVARAVRGGGVFDALYAGHRRWFADRFELLVTDVAIRNHRSRRAHARVGFVDLHRYRDAEDDWMTIALPLAA
jgi:hypothetical protein